MSNQSLQTSQLWSPRVTLQLLLALVDGFDLCTHTVIEYFWLNEHGEHPPFRFVYISAAVRGFAAGDVGLWIAFDPRE